MDALNKYLSATGHHLGVEEERYGGGFRAIIAHRDDSDFLFSMLEGDDFAGTQAQDFFADNPLFPSAYGASPSEATQRLEAKLNILYRFERHADVSKWQAKPLFDLSAEYDTDPGESISTYQVAWGDVVEDLKGGPLLFYDDAKNVCNARNKRDLNALINFKYQGTFAQLL